MGSSFNYVIVPKEIQSKQGLNRWVENYRLALIEEYGGEGCFEGYSGDMASDNGELIVTSEEFNYEGNNLEDDICDMEVELMDIFEPYVKKWGSSVAIRVGNYWVVGGAYSD